MKKMLRSVMLLQALPTRQRDKTFTQATSDILSAPPGPQIQDTPSAVLLQSWKSTPESLKTCLIQSPESLCMHFSSWEAGGKEHILTNEQRIFFTGVEESNYTS